MVDVENLVNEALDAVTVENWKRCVNHCKKLQNSDFVKESLRDEILEQVIMTINLDEDTDSQEDDDNLNL